MLVIIVMLLLHLLLNMIVALQMYIALKDLLHLFQLRIVIIVDLLKLMKSIVIQRMYVKKDIIVKMV